jgi:hypothetical protein
MAADPTYNTKIRMIQGGDQLDVAPGGSITYDGGAVTLTAPAATAATNTTPYGYSQAQADAIVAWIRALDARLKLMGIAA